MSGTRDSRKKAAMEPWRGGGGRKVPKAGGSGEREKEKEKKTKLRVMLWDDIIFTVN